LIEKRSSRREETNKRHPEMSRFDSGSLARVEGEPGDGKDAVGEGLGECKGLRVERGDVDEEEHACRRRDPAGEAVEVLVSEFLAPDPSVVVELGDSLRVGGEAVDTP
jgi:hypothetical protein